MESGRRRLDTTSRHSTGRTVVEVADESPRRRPGHDVDYTWRDSELRSPPLRMLNKMGGRLSRWGVDVPSLTPASVVRAATKLAGSDDFGTTLP